MKLRKPLIKNRDGAAIIEFAIVAPALMLLLMGFVEVGLIMFVQSAMEAATNMGARIGISGYDGGTGNREAYIRSQINSFTGGLVDTNKLTVNITAYNNYNDIGNAALGVAGPGFAGNVVLYQVSYPFPLIVPFLSKLIGNSNGTYTIQVVAPVKNEPSILQ